MGDPFQLCYPYSRCAGVPIINESISGLWECYNYCEDQTVSTYLLRSSVCLSYLLPPADSAGDDTVHVSTRAPLNPVAIFRPRTQFFAYASSPSTGCFCYPEESSCTPVYDATAPTLGVYTVDYGVSVLFGLMLKIGPHKNPLSASLLFIFSSHSLLHHPLPGDDVKLPRHPLHPVRRLHLRGPDGLGVNAPVRRHQPPAVRQPVCGPEPGQPLRLLRSDGGAGAGVHLLRGLRQLWLRGLHPGRCRVGGDPVQVPGRTCVCSFFLCVCVCVRVLSLRRGIGREMARIYVYMGAFGDRPKLILCSFSYLSHRTS
jgi:hypothetical protein